MTNNKTFLVCYCDESIIYNDVKRVFNSPRKELVINKNEYLENEKNNWIYSDKDKVYLNKIYKDGIFRNCWDKKKINKNIEFITCEEVEKLFTPEMQYKFYNNKEQNPISKDDQLLYISKPFFDSTKTKAFFYFSNSKKLNETTKKIAVAHLVNKKWEIIGLIYDGID